MNYRISELLDCLPQSGVRLEEHRDPEAAERVLALTRGRMRTRQPAQKIHRRARPLGALIAAALAVTLLCGTAFAAWKLDLFHFSSLFGDRGELLDSHAAAFDPEAEPVKAPISEAALAYPPDAALGYNLKPLDVAADQGMLRAIVDVSPSEESLPLYRTGELTLGIEGLETRAYLLHGDAWLDRVVVYALLEEPLPDRGATVNFTLTTPQGEATVLKNTNVRITAQEPLDVDGLEGSGWSLDSASTSGLGWTFTGRLESGAQLPTGQELTERFSPRLWDMPLHDQAPLSWPEQLPDSEDLEAWQVERELREDGTFTLRWMVNKGLSGERAEEGDIFIPDLGNTVLETPDYRFTLQSLAAGTGVIYAVVDVEAISDFGMDHLDWKPRFAVANHTHPTSASLLDGMLIGEGENSRRYLVADLGQPGNQPGDVVNLELLEIVESGDLSSHARSLFRVTLPELVPGALTWTPKEETSQTESTGAVSHDIRWRELCLDPLSLTFTGTLQAEDPWMPSGIPVVTVTWKDGTQETVLPEDYRTPADALPEHAPSPHAAVMTHFGGTREQMTLAILPAVPWDVEEIAAVTVDGVTFAP